jgi:STIP1 family protein 1
MQKRQRKKLILSTYSIKYDPTNPLLYTNRAMALLKLHMYTEVIADSLHAISLLEHRDTMKAHFQLAQAQIALHHEREALNNAKIAHALCVEEIHIGGKGGSSIGPITELVLKCKKEDWEKRESERLASRNGLLYELEDALREKKTNELQRLHEKGIPDEECIASVQKKYHDKLTELRSTFEIANTMNAEDKRRKVPDWCVDDITFSVMLDPIVVSVTSIIFLNDKR